MDPLKYIFQKPMATEKLAKWKILLSEFDIIYVTQKAVKGQALADHVAKNPVEGDWRMFFDGATNFKGVGIGLVLVSETGQHYPISVNPRFPCTNNKAEYEACIMGLNLAIDMNIQKLLGMDVIGLIEPTTSNGHRFILVAIDYFTKWVEALAYKVVTKKVVADFVRDRIVCRFGVPESIITNNAVNLNSDLMKTMCESFKIKHKNSIAYRPQMNGAIEAANKNIKKILRKIVENYKQWHEKLPFALFDAKWIRSHYEQLSLIDGKRMNAVCHGQLYQNRMSKAFNKRVRPRQFIPEQLVLKRIFPHQDEAKGKFSPNWQGPYMVPRVVTGGALILAKMDGEIWPKLINSDVVKR
ncbi:uncharacterized protein [Nicotiana sylvestris]|uniref:uncharacterized protein n=1 Tax=Nicotiana sylvestris TaxID=4096 RepID=UPI00388C8C1E